MKRLSHERRILLMAMAAGLPGSLVALILLWTGGYSAKVMAEHSRLQLVAAGRAVPMTAPMAVPASMPVTVPDKTPTAPENLASLSNS